jgi:hypothetical protein
MLNIIKNTINRVFASGVDSDASAFITATGLSGTTQKSAITTLVKDLKSSGLWSKMKAVYPMVTDQRNLYQYTEDFTNAVWQKSGISATGDTTTAPNGTSTADTLQNSNTSGYVRQQNLILSAGQYTQSCYFKKNNNNWVAIYTSDGGANYAIAYFNINTGVVGTTSAIGTFSAASSSIQDAGNGWYRCSLTFTKPSTGATEVSTIVPDADNSFSRTVGQNTFAWGAQLESGGTLSTYQPILTTPSAFMASQMKYNLKDARDLDAAFRLTWSGGWTYSATGATPNGTNGYIDTNLVGNTNISQGNFGFGIYSRTNSSTVGAYGINGALHIYPKFTDGNTYYRIFGGGSAVSGQTTLGLIYGFNDSTSTSYGWFNGVKKQTTPSSNYTIPSTNLMFAGNVTGTGGYDSRQLSFGFASLYLNDSEAQLLNQIVEKYQVALSRGVQAAQSFYYNSAYSNEANTYLYSTQITGTTQVSAINTLINGLKANNLWTKMKAVYPFVTDKTLQADMAAQMKFNLVNPQDTDAAFRLAFSGGWTYSTNGAQPNGTNGYADTKLNLLTNLPGYNNSFSVYFRQNLYGTYKVGALGSSFDQGMSAHLGWTNSSGTLYHDNLGRNTMANSAYGTFDAYHISSVTSTSSQKLYRNGVMKLSGAATSGLTQPSINFYFGAANNNGTAAYFDPKQIAFGTLSTSLTDDEAALLYQLVQEFQTTLSRQV